MPPFNHLLVFLLFPLPLLASILIFQWPFAFALNAAADDPNDSWDINFPCQEYIQKLSAAQGSITKCAANYSSPPRVCTNCIEEYIAFKQQDYRTRHLVEDVFSIDNKTCTTVIYDNYPLSYANEISTALSDRIWEASRCESCLHITWDFVHENSTYAVDQKTTKFKSCLYDWRDCVVNASSLGNICKECQKPFDALFDFYWKIYTDPSVDFCVDVEGTMNDTMNLWQVVWQCNDDPRSHDRHQDITVVIFSGVVLAVSIALFYAGSYIQSERAQADLIQYSRLQVPPRGPRSRLLSSSTLDSSAYLVNSTPTSSTHG